MKAFKQIAAILYKDLLLEIRSKEIISSMLVFSLIVAAIFNFVFDPGSELMRATAPGILWIALIFAGNIGLSRSFGREYENAMMQGLLLCPIDRGLIFVAKVLGNVLFIGVVQVLSLPLMAVLFDLPLLPLLMPLALILFLGALGFAGVGTLFSTISAHTKSREVMLPILLFPVVVPVILAGVKSTAALFNRHVAEVWSWLKILTAFDVIFLTVSFLLYEYVVEE